MPAHRKLTSLSALPSATWPVHTEHAGALFWNSRARSGSTGHPSIAQVALDDRYANKFTPLDSMTIYPKPGHALLYTTFNWWNKMPLQVIPFPCTFHFISSNVDVTQTPTSIKLLDYQHKLTCGLIFNFMNDMIHFVSSYVALLVHRS
jgi:hypothetical protein